MSQTIVRNTIGEQVFCELRDRISTGRLQPGEKLRPDEIAAQLDVSLTPVKEALLRLSAEGLAEATPRHGTVVRRFSKTHAAELFEVREMIETWALRAGYAANRVTPAFLEQIAETIEDLSMTTKDGRFSDVETAMDTDRRMHLLIVGLGGNSMMMDWYRRVISQTEFIHLYAVKPERGVETEVEHRAILAALKTQDLAKVREAIHAHFVSAFNSIQTDERDQLVGSSVGKRKTIGD
ncbi:MAG: GntR family transcriptional regulator [Alphaproteobacteria bacterium]